MVGVAAAGGSTGCIGDLDPQWQLDHDRIIAVRATPSRIPQLGRAALDGFVAVKGGNPTVAQPLAAEVSPTSVAALTSTPNIVIQENGTWYVQTPNEETLDQARTQLGLDPGTPVPIDVGLAFADSDGNQMVAIKTVYADDSADNPTLGAVTLDAAPVAPADALTIAYDLDQPLTIDEDPTWQVNWMTSCGSLLDDDEHDARIHVYTGDPITGEVAVIVRDTLGGVVWNAWPITTTGVPPDDKPKSPTAD
jgi:hypothetical protein